MLHVRADYSDLFQYVVTYVHVLRIDSYDTETWFRCPPISSSRSSSVVETLVLGGWQSAFPHQSENAH